MGEAELPALAGVVVAATLARVVMGPTRLLLGRGAEDHIDDRLRLARLLVAKRGVVRLGLFGHLATSRGACGLQPHYTRPVSSTPDYIT